MSKKRRREQPEVDTQLVEIYEDLANVDEKIRLKAAHTLLTNFVSEGKATGDQLNEILRRLIRGLCSGRKAARLGFSIALTEFLTELLGPNGKNVEGFQGISGLIETLKMLTHVAGNVSGQEERDHEFGRLFGAESIIKSGILFQSGITSEAWDQVLDVTYDLAKKKPWLREECGFILSTSVHNLRDKDLKYSQLIIDKLQTNGLSKTSEGIAIWIAAQSEIPSIKFLSGVWHHDDPLDRKELPRLAKILKEAPAAEPAKDASESKVPQKGVWSSNVHFAWDAILAKLLSTEPAGLKERKKSKRISFVDFWEQCVDDNLFAAPSSEERKFWGFVLFQRMIATAPVHVVPSLFTKNFMRCLTNQLASPERYLHRTADRATKAMVARARTHPSFSSPILKALLTSPHGDVNFDKLTKTKTVETLLSQADNSIFEQLGAIYDELILRPGVQDEREATSRRLIIADQLASAVRNMHIESKVQKLESTSQHVIIRSFLSLLAKYAYFDLEKAPSSQDNRATPPISQASRQTFRSRISSCLTHLVAQTRIDPTYYPHHLITKIHGQGENPEFAPLLLEADGRVREVINTAWERLEKVYVKGHSFSPETSVRDYFQSITLLYSLTLLQVYNEDPEAVIMLAELNDLFKGKLRSKSSHKNSSALVEILLSFISKPSQLFRRLAHQVFTACAANIDEEGLQSMITILETKESLSGQAEMFDQDDGEEDASEASDVEEVDMVDAGSTSSPAENDSKTDDSDGTSESSENDSDGAEDELAAFDAKLAQALGTRPGNEDLDAEDSSLSDEDMDDEQMEAMDEYLEKVFREKKKATSKKTEKKDAKETIVSFKCRVLELLEIYIKQQHDKNPALSLLIPILAAIRTTTSPLVSSKACSLMREYAQLCKGDGVPKVKNADTVFELLEAVHTEAMKEGSNAYASVCSQASLLLVRVLVSHDRECLRRVVRIYGDTQEKALFDATCKIKTSFFTDWQNWCTSARK